MSYSQLNDRDVAWITRRIPQEVRELLRSRSDVFLAGGFIRACIAGEDVQDVDLFAPSKDVANLIALKLKGDGKLIETENAFTVFIRDMPVQVIHRWTFSAPVQAIESFDFTIACSAVWFVPRGASNTDRWESLCHQDFYADLAAKRLVYTKPQRNEDAGGSILRVLKFYQRGYRIPLDSLGAVIARLVKGVDFECLPATSEDCLGQVLTGLLLEVDPLVAEQAAKTTH